MDARLDDPQTSVPKKFKNDMSMMFVFHDALRRDLEHIVRVTARANDDPMHGLRTALGWELFKSYLELHHNAEDDMLWPPMRAALAEDADGLALLDAMEAEHAAIDPLLVSIDAALADQESGRQRLGELTDALATALRAHLRHEESEGLPLVDATVTEQQWQAFGAESGRRLGSDVHRFFPWMLNDATPETVSRVLALTPAPVQVAYRDTWRPAYAELTLWP